MSPRGFRSFHAVSARAIDQQAKVLNGPGRTSQMSDRQWEGNARRLRLVSVGATSPLSERFSPGERVRVNGREAEFLYARGAGAVVRYDSERISRVVLLAKIERSAPR
jgi:hypothetical protein